MIRWPYLILYYLLLFLIAGFTAIVLIAAHPKTLPYLADRLLNENNISYTKIEGSLLSGITIYDLNYADAVLAKRLEIEYAFIMLFKPQPVIKKIQTDQLRLVIRNLPADNDDSSGSLFPAFALSQLSLRGTELILDNETLHFDINASKITYRQDLAIRQLKVHADSSYVKTKLSADKLRVKLKDFLANKEETNSFKLPVFSLAELRLKETALHLDHEELNLELNASKIGYSRDLDVKKLEVRADSSYAKAKIEGQIKSNRLQGSAYLQADPSLSQHYIDIIQGLPDAFVVDIDADIYNIKAQTQLPALSLQDAPGLHLDNTAISVNYSIQDNNLTFDSSYLLSYDTLTADVRQNLIFDPSGTYASVLNLSIDKDPFGLPFQTVTAQVQGDLESLNGHLSAGQLEADIQSHGYKKFLLHTQSKGLSLSAIANLPDILKNNVLSLRSDAVLESRPFSLKGDFTTEGTDAIIDGNFELDMQDQLCQAMLYPKPQAEIWNTYPIQAFAPFKLVYYARDETDILNLDSKILNLTILKNETGLSGWGNLGSGRFDIDKMLFGEKETTLSASGMVPSIHTLMSELGFKSPKDTVLFDAEVDINATVTLSDKINVKSRIRMPWFFLSPDEKTSYKGESFYLESTLTDQKLSIDRYSLNVMNQNIYSRRPSDISFDRNASLTFHEFWVYDNLLLSGMINPAQMQGALRIQSEGFNYAGKDGNVSVKADITARLESDGLQNIEGSITLLDGVITYEPVTDYTISDDVIIIQDIKPKEKTRRNVNIHLTSLRPIAYKSKDVDIRLTPDIILWQEPDSPLSILGMVTIEEGTVKGGSKLFEFDRSEVYFNGADPINPHLNLNMHYYTLDGIDIEIFITNTLGAPLVIFSSKPPMSQNDIMSYILFGEPASSVFESSGEGKSKAVLGSMLLATGLKQIFNDTAGINIDTLNILTNEEGTLGYEIGTRFSKDIRVIYKNDTISSVILQYSLSRSIRFDIDVHETGQGASILYIKDF